MMHCPFKASRCDTDCMLYVPVSDGYKSPFNNKDWEGCSFSLSMMQITKLQESVSTFLANVTTRP
jgi:hypothetical protein